MPCQRIKDGFVCYNKVFRFKGFLFEWGYNPIPLNRDGMTSQRTPRGFWSAMDEFKKIPEADREQYLA